MIPKPSRRPEPPVAPAAALAPAQPVTAPSARRPPRATRQIVGAPQPGPMAMLARWVIRLASRLCNAWRLAQRPLHRHHVRVARRILRKVRGFTGAGRVPRCLCYLRQVDPLVFEEVVLSALEDAGLFVLRNRRYSGDGGIDGVVWLPKLGWYALQVKRYRAHVREQHVGQFALVIRQQGYDGGLFVHTGKSGAAVYGHLGAGGIRLLSGESLVRLVLRAPSNTQGEHDGVFE
ncbi:restriction endonuclease [Pseudoduganella violacea]|uniref:Restriction system protein n=1 Tax=Pseudoduganella violacea TaxID=1715466 RepID=A0A7W5FWY5_9BURK|nr:restriction endonuclease [Pseudoduganella violacea]MBB3121733.1 restriction system protein [Pseudoduganella violacea]